MLKVGLTGSIASGKTSVGEMFVALGARLLQADRIAHDLMLPGQPVYEEVVRHFGKEILNQDATINRARLAEAAFGSNLPVTNLSPTAKPASPSRIQELNRIVHPAVVRRQNEWMHKVGEVEAGEERVGGRGRGPNAVAMVEAALLIEAGAAKHFDKLIVVTCTDEQRAARFAARQKIDLEAARREVERRMAAQMPQAEKIKAADFVIDNSGSLADTQEGVNAVWEKLQLTANPVI